MSQRTKWTPGPWRHVSTLGGWDGVKEDAGPSNICLLSFNNPANADLIAAAPELYEAVASAPILSKYHGQRGFDVERFIEDYEAWRVTCRAALAKARGE